MTGHAGLADPERIDAFVDLLGEAQATRMIAAFADELDSAPATIRLALASGNIAVARAAAHRLRGAALNLGCQAVADAAGALEDGADAMLEACAADLARAAEMSAAALRALPIGD